MAIAAVILLAGCATTGDPYFQKVKSKANIFVAPGTTHIAKVAVLPFRAPTELIGASVSDLFVTELLRTRRYELVERSQMARVLSESELALAGLSASRAAEVGAMMGAEGVVIGTVDEYATVAVRGRTYAVVGISARLIDVETGKVMWSADLAKRADSAEKTLPMLAREVVHEMTAGLYQNWHVQRIVRRQSLPSSLPSSSTPPSGSVQASAEAPVARTARVQPPPPEGFEVGDQGLREVIVRWSRAPNAAKVRVERAQDPRGPFVVAGEVEARAFKFIDRGSKNKPLADGSTYYYRLSAISTEGVASSPTAVKESMTAPPPDPPMRPRAEPAGPRAVMVAWEPPRSEGIVRYEIERAPAAEPDRRSIAGTVMAPPFRDGGGVDSPLEDSTEYVYRVRAVNRVGAVGAFSEPVRVKTAPPPTPPRNPRAVGGLVRSVLLEWDPSSDTNVVAYEIWRSEAEEGPFERVGTVKGRQQATYMDGGKEPGQLRDDCRYFYQLKSVNIVQSRSDFSERVSAATRKPPPAPEGLRAESDRPRSVPLSWNASPDERVIGYRIERSVVEREAFVPVADVRGRGVTSWVDRGGETEGRKLGRLADGTAYRYRIAAYNIATAVSPWSATVSATTKPAPARPTFEWASTNKPRSVALEWRANPEADIASYRIEAAESENGRFRTLEEVAAAQLNYLHTGVPDGAARWYRIRAIDRDGLESPWSIVLRGAAKPLPPPPQKLHAHWEDEEARLRWTMPEGAPPCSFRVFKVGMMGLQHELIGETDEPEFALSKDAVGKGLRVCITAVDEDKLESARSTPLEIRPPPVGPSPKETTP